MQSLQAAAAAAPQEDRDDHDEQTKVAEERKQKKGPTKAATTDWWQIGLAKAAFFSKDVLDCAYLPLLLRTLHVHSSHILH